jgi:hypothetical protein
MVERVPVRCCRDDDASMHVFSTPMLSIGAMRLWSQLQVFKSV